MPHPPRQQKTRPLASFAPDNFAKLIQGRGLLYRWSRAVPCPCRLNTDTDQFDVTCSRCGSSGWMYVNPFAQEERHLSRDFTEVKAIFSSVSDKPSVVETQGEWDFGEATLTVQSEMRVGFRDRFVGVQQEMAWAEILERGPDKIPVGRHGMTTAQQRTAMRYAPVRINYVEDDDGAGTRTVYYENTDYQLVAPCGDLVAHMEWLTGRGPPAGRRYVVHYDVRPVWVVDQGVFRVQNSIGPQGGLKGAEALQVLPTTFKVMLDYLTQQQAVE